jgi:hypothetical protein
MKTTIDLPEALVREAKLRALRQGRTLRDLIAEFIRQGLNDRPGHPDASSSGVLERDADGLPVFRRDPDVIGTVPDLPTLLALEHSCLVAEDRQRAGLSD